jgi:hypothetical protein
VRYSVETWDPRYGAGIEPELEGAGEPVEVSVEVAAQDWEPVTPAGANEVATVVFVDGVRRIDCRVWITDGSRTRPGLCASVAAGAVRCEPGAATLVAVEVRRGLHTAAADTRAIATPRGGDYELRPTHGDAEGDLYSGIQNHMTELEAEVSEVSEVVDGAELVVFDGPLRRREQTGGVGYVKSQHVQYLPDELQPVVMALDAGQRTPLFAIEGQYMRWSWYLRLPGPRAHGLSGIVRLELPRLGDVSCAAHRADQVSATLPRFASEAHKEPRAPQNLYPVAGLEHRLRHRLGDPHLLERDLRLASLTR